MNVHHDVNENSDFNPNSIMSKVILVLGSKGRSLGGGYTYTFVEAQSMYGFECIPMSLGERCRFTYFHLAIKLFCKRAS